MPKTRVRYTDIFTMREAARQAGIGYATLKSWQAKHDWAKPDTMRGGRPGFSLARIAEMREHVD
jgi:transposase